MLLTATSGTRGWVIDLDTGRPIPKVICCDTDTGYFEAYQVDAVGEVKRDPLTGDLLTYHGKGRLKFIPTAPRPVPRRNVPISPDADLAALARRVDSANRVRGRPRVTHKHKRVLAPLFDLPCEHYGCARLADWTVSDEVELPPLEGRLRGRKVLFPRARTVAVRAYCATHYKAPRLVDAKGEVVETFSKAGGVRPQGHSA